jgi:hypothetical protein
MDKLARKITTYNFQQVKMKPWSDFLRISRSSLESHGIPGAAYQKEGGE